MMSKWSSKPADHKAVRQRNNQRRHRKKVKDHIAELESKLTETQLQLDQALTRIMVLSEELEQARKRCMLESHDTLMKIPKKIGADEPLKRGYGCQSIAVSKSCKLLDPQDDPLTVHQEENETSTQTSLAPTQFISSTLSVWNPSPTLSAPWTSDTTVQAVTLNYEAFASSEDQDCCNLPAPEPGKSTTRCRDAYFMITQQNYKTLDNSSIRGWLEPGFRRAVSEGDGCRVDTDLLFTLLDFISSSGAITL